MLTEDEVRTILLPHQQSILDIHDKALNHFVDKYSDDRYLLCKRTQANILRDLLVNYARLSFDGRVDQGIRLIDRANGTFYVEFDGQQHNIEGAIIARFKKVNDQLITANIPTRTALAFENQQPFLPFPNVTRLVPTNINIGHLPNDMRTAYHGIFLTSPNGRKSIAWSFALIAQQQNAAPQVVDLPIATTIEEKKTRRVTAKGEHRAVRKKQAGD